MKNLNTVFFGVVGIVMVLSGGVASAQTTSAFCHTFNSNLKVGDTGVEIYNLRIALEKDGTGSFGTADDMVGIAGQTKVFLFNELVASAVTGFQEKYASEILTPNGLKHGTGYVGPSTRAKLNSLYGCGQPPPVLGCRPGDLFNSQTGQSCTIVPPIVCRPGDLFNSQTGQRCSTAGAPAISGISGPTSLASGQQGTWTVSASNPDGGTLSYSVRWGDEVQPAVPSSASSITNIQQTATFAHAYGAGVWKPTFTVTNSAGKSASASISVNVGMINTTPPRCPFGGADTSQPCVLP